VSQREFATRWAGSGNHAFVRVLQQSVGDVVWHELSLAPELEEATHETVGCRVRLLRSSWLHRRLWRLFYLSPQAWRWRRTYRAYALVASYLAPLSRPLLGALWRDRPDVLFAQDYATGRFEILLMLTRLLGARLVAYHAGSLPKHYLGRPLKRVSLRRADCLLVSSRAELERLVSDHRVLRERVRVVLTPIDLKTFSPAPRADACRAAGLDPSRRYFLFVGRLEDPIKRVGVLIKAFAPLARQHPDADLVVVGDGPDRDTLCGLASAHCPGRVRFAGWVTGPAALASLYRSAEVLVLPSLSEGFPNVVGEAMGCGTPVLGSDVGGIPELVVPGETGWLVPAGDDPALAAALAEILEHPDALAAMRSRARAMAEARVAPEAVAALLRPCFRRSG
jgi:glycosyltransferase involved in cell wall biosynthesis